MSLFTIIEAADTLIVMISSDPRQIETAHFKYISNKNRPLFTNMMYLASYSY